MSGHIGCTSDMSLRSTDHCSDILLKYPNVSSTFYIKTCGIIAHTITTNCILIRSIHYSRALGVLTRPYWTKLVFQKLWHTLTLLYKISQVTVCNQWDITSFDSEFQIFKMKWEIHSQHSFQCNWSIIIPILSSVNYTP